MSFASYSEDEPLYELIVLAHGAESALAKAVEANLASEEKKDVNVDIFTLLNKDILGKAEKFCTSPEELDRVFSISLALTEELPEEQLLTVLSQASERLTANAEWNAPLRLRLLSVVFNMIPEDANQLKIDVFNALLSTASSTKNHGAVSGMLEQGIVWSEEWGLTAKEQVDLAAKMCEIVEKSSDETKKHGFLLRYFQKIDALADSKEDQAALTAAIDHALPLAATLVKSLLAAKDVYAFDHLRTLTPIVALGQSKQYKPLSELLNIFINGTSADYATFAKQNSGNTDLPAVDGLQKKIDFLSVTNFCLGKEYATYAGLAQALDLFDGKDTTAKLTDSDVINKVEDIVVGAIFAGLIDGKLDALTQRVAIYKAKERVFDKRSWSELDRSLTNWMVNIGHVLSQLPQMTAD